MASFQSVKRPTAITVSVLTGALLVGSAGCSRATDLVATATTTSTPTVVIVPVDLDLPVYEPPELNLEGANTHVNLKTCEQVSEINNEVLGFARNSAELPTDPAALENLREILLSFSTAPIVQVDGYTSYSDGSYEHNVALSEARAQAVAEFGRTLLPHIEFSDAGHGPTNRVSIEDDTEASRIPNRRVILSGTVELEECREL